MKNFSNVFLAVKEHCEIAGFKANQDCFETIAETAKIPVSRVGFYLNVLQNLGLIDYSAAERYIQMTETGVMQDQLFLQ